MACFMNVCESKVCGTNPPNQSFSGSSNMIFVSAALQNLSDKCDNVPREQFISALEAQAPNAFAASSVSSISSAPTANIAVSSMQIENSARLV